MIALSPTEPVPKTATELLHADAERIDDGAGAGHDAAAEWRQHLKRRLFRHFDDASLADHGVRRERGLSLIIMNDLAAFRQRARPVDARAGEISIVEFIAVDRKS